MKDFLISVNEILHEHALTLLSLLVLAFIAGTMVPWYFLSSVPRHRSAVIEVVKEDISSVTIKDRKSQKQFLVVKDGNSLKVIDLPKDAK